MHPIVIIFTEGHVAEWDEVVTCLTEAGYASPSGTFYRVRRALLSRDHDIKQKIDGVLRNILEQATSYFKNEVRLGITYALGRMVSPLSIKPGELIAIDRPILEPETIEHIQT